MYQKLNAKSFGQSESADLRPVPMDLEQLRSLAESENAVLSGPLPVGPELRPVPFDLEQTSLPEPEACEVAKARQKPEPANTQVKQRRSGRRSKTRSA